MAGSLQWLHQREELGCRAAHSHYAALREVGGPGTLGSADTGDPSSSSTSTGETHRVGANPTTPRDASGTPRRASDGVTPQGAERDTRNTCAHGLTCEGNGTDVTYAEEPPVSVVLVDDSGELRGLVRRRLERTGQFDVVG